MNQHLLEFLQLKDLLEGDCKREHIADTYVGICHLREISRKMSNLGRILERNGIDIEDIHKQVDEGKLKPSLASVSLYLQVP